MNTMAMLYRTNSKFAIITNPFCVLGTIQLKSLKEVLNFLLKRVELLFKIPKLDFKTPKLPSSAFSLQVLGYIPHKKFACK